MVAVDGRKIATGVGAEKERKFAQEGGVQGVQGQPPNLLRGLLRALVQRTPA